MRKRSFDRFFYFGSSAYTGAVENVAKFAKLRAHIRAKALTKKEKKYKMKENRRIRVIKRNRKCKIGDIRKNKLSLNA